MRKLIALLAGLLVLCLVNYSIYSREQILHNGQVVLLELAPVDPRSIMQGDYMALAFDVGNRIRWNMEDGRWQDGYVVLSLDPHGVASYSHIDDGNALQPGQLRMRYRVRNDRVRFATDAYFFQEGDAQIYEAARYGEFRVAANGQSILVGMRDSARQNIGRRLID